MQPRELSPATKKLIERYVMWKHSGEPKEGSTTLHVDEVASRVAAFYERLRTIVDWKEEHLMRRSAIIRKIKRRFLDLEINNFSGSEGIAEALLFELIRGGHFPNDKIEESMIPQIQKIIDKYIFIIKNNPENKKGKAGMNFYNWLLEVCACEIEETLAPPAKEMAMIDYMFLTMKEKIKVSDGIYQAGLLKKEDTDVQIYIAVQQALYKFDRPLLSYNLIKYKYPQWPDASDDLLQKIAQNAFKIFNKIEEDLSHPLAKKFYNICEKYDTPYLLLGDILSQETAEQAQKQLSDPSALEALLKKSYKKRLSTLQGRIWRAAVYSTISIFITKILSLLILEVLLARLITGHLDITTLIADIIIPTALMFLLVSTIKRPSEHNLTIAVMETMKIVYKYEKTDSYEIKLQRKKGTVTITVLSLIYALSAVASFGAIYRIFDYFAFPVTSIIINMIFIAVILFTGTAVRKRAQELTIEDEKEGFISFVSDIFFLPIAGMGRWLSNKWKKYNVITAFLNAMIDMPFSVFVEFLEKWRYFIKERKEEMQ